MSVCSPPKPRCGKRCKAPEGRSGRIVELPGEGFVVTVFCRAEAGHAGTCEQANREARARSADPPAGRGAP